MAQLYNCTQKLHEMSEQAKREYEKIAEHLEVEQGQMFGKLCLKHSKKAFAAFDKGAMVFKLGHDVNKDLLKKYESARLWDPSDKGRPMKDWLQVPEEFIDDWLPLAKQAQITLDQDL